MSRPRRMMAASTANYNAADINPRTRPLTPVDAQPLARLMFDAYRGTIDDEGESLDGALAEVRRTFEGAYGAMVWEASFVIPSAEDPDVFDSASVVTISGGEPLLAFSMTRPELKRRGLAGDLIRASARSLAARGHQRVRLVVTIGNTAAERLYEKLGFEDVREDRAGSLLPKC